MTDSSPEWVVVSGAGGRLGREIVRHYATHRRVLALDAHFADETPQTGDVVRVVVDLTSEQGVKDALATIPFGQKIRLCINAVGRIWNEPVLQLSKAKLTPHNAANWRDVIEANLTAPFLVSTQIAVRMARGGGSIVNFSSISAGGNPGQLAYSAAKAGVEGMTRTMAKELGPFGIRVNAVSLGFIDVASTRDAVGDRQLQSMIERTPMGRLGAIDDVINAIEFLADNQFVTGTVVDVNGGLRL